LKRETWSLKINRDLKRVLTIQHGFKKGNMVLKNQQGFEKGPYNSTGISTRSLTSNRGFNTAVKIQQGFEKGR
jgi:hypothetical protein